MAFPVGSTETIPFRIVAIGPGGYLSGPRPLSKGLGTGLLTGQSDLGRRRSDADSAMKLRSALLIACLIVVPLLAMVSHKIPAATRAAVREKLWSPIVGALSPKPASVQPPNAEPAAGEPTLSGVPIDPTAPAVGEGLDPIRQRRSAVIGTAPTDPIRLPEPTPSIDPSSRPREQSAPSALTAPPPAILVGAESSLPIGEANGRELLEARLRALGATQIDWTPAQGGDGFHRCSCRIPAEPTGQLHRVFQAAAADPLTALDNLVGQVTAWSMRSGGAAEGEMAAGASMPRR